jgi:hypothetical protein
MKRALMLIALLATAANAATIRGKVTFPNGAPCPGVAAKAADAANHETTTAYTDRDGMYYIHDVPPGRYTVVVTKGRTTQKVAVVVTSAPYADAATVPVQ